MINQVSTARAKRWAAVIALTVIGMAACATWPSPVNRDFDASKAHHRASGFVNSDGKPSEEKSFWQWQLERWRNDVPKPPQAPILGVSPDLDALRNQAPGRAALTWVGHATVLLHLDGLNVLSDPHWSERASPVSFAGPKRHQPPGVPFDDLPPIHAVVISHNHFDHLDLPTVRRLMAAHRSTIKFYVPLGVQHWFADHVEGSVLQGASRNVIALDWHEASERPGTTAAVTFRLLPIHHWSRRALNDRNLTLWGSWSITHPNFRFWFGGDFGHSADTAQAGKRYGPFDVAAIPIGAYEPRWFMKDHHINPDEAVTVMQELRARTAVGIHWGTFEDLTDEPLDQPPLDLSRALDQRSGPRLDFRVLKHGQTVVF